jgi:hypothetical protein
MIKIGANTVVFGGESIRTAMQHLKWAGYDAVEISALQGQDVDAQGPALQQIDHAHPRIHREQLEDTGEFLRIRHATSV